MSIDELRRIQKSIKSKSLIIDISSYVIIIIVLCCRYFSLKNSIYSVIVDDLFSCIINVLIIVALIRGVFIKIKQFVIERELKEFNDNYKKTFILSSLMKSFDNLTYDFDRGLPMDVIASTELIDLADAYSSNDYVSGTYRNIRFEQADVIIEKRDEDDDYIKVFLGKWIIFDFGKKFYSNIHIYKRSLKNWWKGKYKEIKLEDETFNKKYLVFAENEHDAFYVLTPHFMEKIDSVMSKLDCEVSLGFVDNKLHIAINNYNDSFEYNVYKEINEEKIISEVSKDIKIIIDFVDELQLDNDLFKNN
ncbi:MAG: DUF3137 domain-containing protein [Bacilli bacterium]|nr:DUF3137 domain-containing protein [Bacilli bacterium]